MNIKHWQGYGTVTAVKVKDKNNTLHVRVTGNHEWGLRRNDEYDLFNWLVKRFDKSQTDYMEWHQRRPQIFIREWEFTDENGLNVDACDYYFKY
jgi:hypothetical protein